MRKKLELSDIVVIVDSREQTPLDMDPMKTVRGTLTTGDYSVAGLTQKIAVERKSLQDLIMCCGQERERFDREIKRLLAYDCRMILVEDDIKKIRLKMYRGNMEPNAVLSSVMGWIARGVPIFFADDRTTASDLLKRFLYISAQRVWADCYDFMLNTKENLNEDRNRKRQVV